MGSILFNEMPEIWHQWPCRIDVAFSLTPYSCVYREIYEEYAASDCNEIAEKIFNAALDQVFVHYRVRADGFVPAFNCYAYSPLKKKSKHGPFEPRTNIGNGASWEKVADDTLFEIWQRPNGVLGNTTTLMLRAGGRNEQEADMNWMKCAKPFRKILRQTKNG